MRAPEEQGAPDLVGLGAAIRTRRERLGLSQYDVAQRIGVRQADVSNLEHGRRGLPSLSRLALLADALEMPLRRLVEATGYPVGTLDVQAFIAPADRARHGVAMLAPYEPDLVTLGAYVRAQRLRTGLSAQVFGQKVGIALSSVYALENGRYGLPRLPALTRLAGALGISLACLIEAAGYWMEGD